MQPFSRSWNGKVPSEVGPPPWSSAPTVVLLNPSYRNYGSGPTKYPLADMLQFVLEFATTKPPNVATAEDPRPSSPSPSQAGQPVAEAVSPEPR